MSPLVRVCPAMTRTFKQVHRAYKLLSPNSVPARLTLLTTLPAPNATSITTEASAFSLLQVSGRFINLLIPYRQGTVTQEGPDSLSMVEMQSVGSSCSKTTGQQEPPILPAHCSIHKALLLCLTALPAVCLGVGGMESETQTHIKWYRTSGGSVGSVDAYARVLG